LCASPPPRRWFELLFFVVLSDGCNTLIFKRK
jgi:hypothetical protein